MREAKFAGSFYEKYENSLLKQLEGCFLDKNGPGALPSGKGDKIKAAIVPHAGYTYSGACAAWAYKAIAEAGLPDLFIIIGPTHHHPESGFSMETYETPLGYVRVHQDFARKLGEKGHIKQNEKIFEGEHCIEVQLPFLQFVFKKNIEKIKVLPILISDDVDLDNLALDLKELLIDSGLNAVFLISSDFTHYGRDFHYVPFSKDVKQKIYDQDGDAINFIKNQDAAGFLSFVKENFITICGFKPIYLLLKAFNFDKALLEQYYTSGDLSGDYKNTVSYASIIFR